MKRSALWAKLIFISALQISFVTQAQENMTPKKYENPQWKRFSLTSFKGGQRARAKDIVNNYYLKASEKAGTPRPAMIIDLVTGDWDVLTIWDMQEGLEEFNWETSPNSIKWRKALDEIAGGAPKAKAILDEFESLVLRRMVYIGRSRL